MDGNKVKVEWVDGEEYNVNGEEQKVDGKEQVDGEVGEWGIIGG